MLLNSFVDSLEIIFENNIAHNQYEEVGSLLDLQRLQSYKDTELYKVFSEQGFNIFFDRSCNKIKLIGDEDNQVLNIPYDILDDYAVDKLIYGVSALLGFNLIHHYLPKE